MKRLILLLSLTLILALMVAGCASSTEPGNTGADELGTLEEATPAAGVIETPMVEDAQPGAVVPEESDMAAEESGAVVPDESGAPVEEPGMAATAESDSAQADMAEPPTTEEGMESAQADAATTEETEVIPPTGAVNPDRISNLLDFEVWNNNNEHIGDVNTMVINTDISQIEYVIVGIGGFLGIGEKELPVPWQVLQLQAATPMEAESSTQEDDTLVTETPQNVFILDISREELEQTPDFDLSAIYEQPQDISDETQAPDTMSLEELEQEIQSFWQNDLSLGTDTSDEAMETDQTAGQQSDQMVQPDGAKNLMLAEDLLGVVVRAGAIGLDQPAGDTEQDLTAASEDQGIVEEIMVDANLGQVTYLLVSLDAFMPGIEAPAGGLQPPPADGGSGVQEPATGAITDDALIVQVVPVPLTALEWNAEEEVLTYTGSESLDQAPVLDLEEVLNDQSATWSSQADSFWGLEGSEPETE